MHMKKSRLAIRLFSTLLATFTLTAAIGVHADTSPVVPKGVLTLQLGAVDQFIWGPTQQTQAITGTRCALSTGSTLMAVTTTASIPGINSDSIGIAGTASSGVPCGRVSVGEGALRLTLGSALAGLVVTKGSFDMEVKKNAVIKAVTYDQVGGAPSQTYYLVTGTSKNNPQYSQLPNADLTSSCHSDSGPDSGASDNCRWNITGQWTKIEFSALVGEFGLEGGADGSGATTFDVGQVGDGFLGCPTSQESNVILPPPDPVPGQPTISGTRLGNVDDPNAPGGAPECVAVPYDISTTCPTGVTGACTNFEYDPLSQGTNMTFSFHWEWPPEVIPVGGIEGVDPTVQFFINGNPVGVELDFCPEIVPQYDDGVFIGIDPAHPVIDQDSAAGTQAGCLLSRQVKQLDEPNKIQVIEDAYVQGDYAARRN